MKFVAIEPVKLKRLEGIFVGLLSALDESDTRDTLKNIPSDDPNRERLLMIFFMRRYVATQDGNSRFDSDDQAREFLSKVSAADVSKIIKAGQMLNSLSDEAIEGESKN